MIKRLLIFLLLGVSTANLLAQNRGSSLYIIPTDHLKGGSTTQVYDYLAHFPEEQLILLPDEDMQFLEGVMSSTRKRRHWQQKIAGIENQWLYVDSNGKKHYLIYDTYRVIDLTEKEEYLIVDVKPSLGLGIICYEFTSCPSFDSVPDSCRILMGSVVRDNKETLSNIEALFINSLFRLNDYGCDVCGKKIAFLTGYFRTSKKDKNRYLGTQIKRLNKGSSPLRSYLFFFDAEVSAKVGYDAAIVYNCLQRQSISHIDIEYRLAELQKKE